MPKTALEVKRLPCRLDPDSGRVITRFFCPGDDARNRGIIERVLTLTEEQVADLKAQVEREFSGRHRDLDRAVAEHFGEVERLVPDSARLSTARQWLIGAYFTMEYAIESAALFNPSMVPAMDQRGVPAGSTRFFMSLRATGEGHLSSIVFRRGVIDAQGNIHIDPASPYSRRLKVVANRTFQKETYRLKLIEMGGYTELADTVMARLGEQFLRRELEAALDQIRETLDEPSVLHETVENMLTLARSNYQLHLPPEADPSEVVIYPTSENESRGIEDVRLVLFRDDDGSTRYYGPYTAYNGFHIIPQLLEISDQQTIRVHTITGCYAQNKGMALFPRKLNGLYMMVSRLDNENLFLMESDNVRFWNYARMIQSPKFAWEMVQIGNCGSPLETGAGWLLLTHGVGPMRQYCIGASLLDLEDPSKLIGQTEDPLLVPTDDERVGYVPNVVYSCGGMIHNDTLIIPYAMSDISTSFASVSLPELLSLLRG